MTKGHIFKTTLPDICAEFVILNRLLQILNKNNTMLHIDIWPIFAEFNGKPFYFSDRNAVGEIIWANQIMRRAVDKAVYFSTRSSF